MRKLIHLQPFIPHYREEFFNLLSQQLQECSINGKPWGQEIYTYEKTKNVESASFNISRLVCKHIPSKLFKGKLLLYNPFPLLKKDNKVLVLMLHFGHISTWLLLLTQFLHRRKIILWGQGISVRRYQKEERKPDWKLKWMIALADGVWLYMDKEKEQWQKLFPNKPIAALHNTLTGIEEMVKYHPIVPKEDLKAKYGIKQEVILIFCARFTSHRRIDLLLETIKRLDSKRFGLVIIGAGNAKPDFSSFNNIYDFGSVYDTAVKRELFALADAYFQPGWVGLSIVEAMAYGKPIFTFSRSEETLQCVEYSYIQPDVNGMVFSCMEDCISTINRLSTKEMKRMGDNARRYAAKHLTVGQMVDNAMSVVKEVCVQDFSK